MSVYKSLRRKAKNSYVLFVNDLLDYTRSRSFTLLDDSITGKSFKEAVDGYCSTILDRSVIVSSIELSRMSNHLECERKRHYIGLLDESLQTLSKYLSFMLNYMTGHNVYWRSRSYTMKVFQILATKVVGARDALVDLLQYIDFLESERDKMYAARRKP